MSKFENGLFDQVLDSLNVHVALLAAMIPQRDF